MPTEMEKDPTRAPQAPSDADAGSVRQDATPTGEESPDAETIILLPMTIDARRDRSRDARAAKPIIIDAEPVAARRPRSYGAFAASVAAGLIVGFLLGSRTGVKEALDAGKPEIASAAERQESAPLLDEVRSLRAQVESLRHGGEALRVAERLRALEAARDADRDAGRANEKAIASASTRIDKIEARLDLVERAKIDRTPTGAVPKADRGGVARAADMKRKEASAAFEPKTRHPRPSPGGYVLRDVAGGLALVERPDGWLEEVARGDDLPGAGRVTAIERRAQGWVVVTSRGVIDRRSD